MDEEPIIIQVEGQPQPYAFPAGTPDEVIREAINNDLKISDTPITDFISGAKEGISQGLDAAGDYAVRAAEELMLGRGSNYQEFPAQKFMDRMADDRRGQDAALTDTIASMRGVDAQQQKSMGLPSNTRPLYDPAKSAAENSAGALEGGVQIAGNMAERVGSLVGNAAMTLGGAGVDALPEAAVEYTAGLYDDLLNSNVGKYGVAMLKELGTLTEPYLKKYPQEAKTLMSLANVGLLGAPSQSAKIANRTFTYGEEMLQKGIDANATKFAKGLLAPVDKRPDADRRGEMDEKGLLNQRTYEPTKFDLERARAVAAVEGTNPNRTTVYNIKALKKEIWKLKNKLDKDIRNNQVNDIDIDDLNRRLDKKVANLDADPMALTMSGQAKTWAEGILRKATYLLEESDGTPLGILNARRELDKWIDTHEGSYVPEIVSARNKAITYVRDLLNEEVVKAVPSVGVKESLALQSKLLSAKGLLFDRSKTEGENVLSRMMAQVSKTHVGPVGLYTLSGILPGIAAAMGVPAGTATLAGLTGAGVLTAYYTLDSATRRKWLGGMIKYTSKQIKEGSNVEQLKLDRALLIDMLNQEASTEEEAQ